MNVYIYKSIYTCTYIIYICIHMYIDTQLTQGGVYLDKPPFDPGQPASWADSERTVAVPVLTAGQGPGGGRRGLHCGCLYIYICMGVSKIGGLLR